MDYKDFVGELYLKEVRARTPKGETLPITIESLQAMRYEDGQVIMEQAQEINRLQQVVNKLQQKLGKQETSWES